MALKRIASLAVALALLILLAAAGWVAWQLLPRPLVPDSALQGKFVPLPLPEATTKELFDLGVADVDGDGRLDIFSSNHNTRQILWVSQGRDGYRDMVSAWGFDQNPEFPGAEISDALPEVNEPGVYVYWQGRNPLSKFPLVIRAHRLKELRPLEGSLQSYSVFGSHETDAFTVHPPTARSGRNGEMAWNSLAFSADRDGVLKVVAASPGVPITVGFGSSISPANIFVGPQKVRPSTNEFTLVLQDRHGYAWADINDDSHLDAFISRGAIGGTLKKFPVDFQAKVQDELLLSDRGGRYGNAGRGMGIEKHGCSGRKATWVDFDLDGRLDLFVNCMERGFVEGLYPKQLYRQAAQGKFTDVAEEIGLGLAAHEIIDFAWVDVDNDGYPDLVTHEGKGFALYRNEQGKSFSEQFLGRGKFVRADRPQLRGSSDEYWFVDGKLAAADFDGDGDIDVFVASKMGNTLLLNGGKGGLSLVEPSSLGLPGQSAAAGWMDFDNDGRIDLFAVPQGLFRQGEDQRFAATGLLALPERKYMAAIANLADLDNDGRRDVVVALLENFSNWNWLEKQRKTPADRFTWHLAALRNAASEGSWLEVELVGPPGNAQAIGARVTARTATGQQTQVVGQNDGAFFSQGHYRLYFGLGSSPRVDSLQIVWPDGYVQEVRDLPPNRLHVITRAAEATQETKQ
jgi:hypothetical protein